MSRYRILALLPLAILPLAAHADDLGVAGGFNVFIFNAMQSHGSDTQGKLAVGGSASLTNYQVGLKYTGPTADTLVVGGALSFNSGSVENGKYWVGGAVSPSPTGTRDNSATSPNDFNAVKTDLLAKSSSWSGLANAGTKAIDQYNGGITLTGTSLLSVFSVTATEFLNSHNATAINATAGSTVIINVSGTSVVLNNSGYSVNGSNGYNGTNVNVLYNFYEATSLKFSGSPIGAFLAPKANVEFNNGALYGTLIANNLNVGVAAYSDSGQFDQHLFGGSIPRSISTVPAPTALFVVALNSAGLAFRRRRKA